MSTNFYVIIIIVIIFIIITPHTYLASNHEVPISQMGNYQEHLKKINPLRGVDTGTVKTQLFGNPYRLEKNDTKVCVCVYCSVSGCKMEGGCVDCACMYIGKKSYVYYMSLVTQ